LSPSGLRGGSRAAGPTRALRAGALLTLAVLVIPGAPLLASRPLASAGASADRTPPTGELVEEVAPEADPSQTYTLYLPPGYGEPGPEGTQERRYPALLILDPRGRGTQAAEIFQPAAERFGWILVSSNHTASDGPMEPNLRAVNALMPELARRWAADPARIYAAGMSGTAVVAWGIARQTGALAGVLAAAAPNQPQVFDGVEKVGFAHFGTVGIEDFNFNELRAMDAFLGELGAPHRLELFEGAHGWMPRDLATNALGWMEVQAIRQGRRAMDAELVRAQLTADLERARSWESKGDPLAALWSYQALLEGYRELAPVERDLARVRETVKALSEEPAVAREREEVARGAERESRLRRELGELGAVARRGELPSGAKLIDRLRVRELKKEAAGEGQTAAAARRMLATLVTYTGSYLRRELWQRKAWAQAAAVLEVAAEVRPERPELWYDLACARALSGRREPALEALQTAVDKGFADVEHLEADLDLEALRDLEEYRALVTALRGDG